MGNACVGVVVFLVVPEIFFTGLALVPIGVYLSKWAFVGHPSAILSLRISGSRGFSTARLITSGVARMNVGLANARGVFLSCDCYGMIFLSVGYARKHGSAMTRYRLDGQLSIHQTEPLTHADQAEPSTIDRVPPIETNS